MFSALLAEFKGVFGKEYLLAGLLPAALLAIGWDWFRSGELVQVFTKLTALSSDEAPAELLSSATIVLLLGLAFFAARSFLVGFCQHLPGRTLRPLRDSLIRRQTVRRLRSDMEGHRLAHLIDVLEWAANGEFPHRTFLPDYESVPTAAEMRDRSEPAREIVVSLANQTGWKAVRMPTPEQTTSIVRGLGSLYAYASSNHHAPECQQLIAKWKAALNIRTRSVLRIVSDSLSREYARNRVVFEKHPDPAWMQPTALGNRAAALDDYAKNRYGIDTTPLVNRLTGVLAAEERQGLSDARLTVAVLVNLAAAMLLLGTAAVIADFSLVWPYLSSFQIAFAPRAALFIVCPLLLSYLFYRAAVFAYGSFAEKVMRNVDLHRLSLLKQLGYALPNDVREENALWKELGGFFVQANDLDPDRPLKASE